ncbi:hypothetical protein [Clostridium magnum]|uniref:Uncharacterized protein n=1 Tax=Clostridium magnum DSM 2767 TaxID=1121326 RepID=A0A161YTB4_9CLOT|nr:hypothetical protein [Clostridium magnum]KZL94332.1 hypothetical protein CLMAG_13850 [Clostridium magnum DSM 2767]SHJ54666.1 hypothetical protein SAMN02745944_06136 [Clostridium magnum DSM 2767]
MKVAITLNKISRFNIDLPEIDATRLYNHLVRAALGSETVQDSEVKKVEDTKEIVIAEEQEPKEYVMKRLVMVKCPHCNELLITVVGIKDGQIVSHKSLSCKKCHGEIPISELKLALYECPNCGVKADFFIMGDLEEVHCKKCASVIDLIWNEKRKRYISANLLERK